MPDMPGPLHVYLMFGGECREAMSFYQSCLGGELNWQTIEDIPEAYLMPPVWRSYVVQATLRCGPLVLMGTDLIPEGGRITGNHVSMLLRCATEKEMRQLYRKLSRGGLQDHPIKCNHWGEWVGDLTDRYGNRWLLHCAASNRES
jgi:PhnB protein